MAIDWIRKCFFLLAISSFGLVAGAQQPHFIYVQTDNGDPFYVKINQKIVSSSADASVGPSAKAAPASNPRMRLLDISFLPFPLQFRRAVIRRLPVRLFI